MLQNTLFIICSTRNPQNAQNNPQTGFFLRVTHDCPVLLQLFACGL
ncbi:hypothetical protein FORC44_3209 [Escherichia coli]|nr:hypothetical protein EDL933_1782 [Escherichia coli O157:H7 str. EDL933]ASL59962.1 hypothetical protein FORC44_3209 [Escherichia coli]EEC26907.1 hypothetical protein ESCCO14588_3036 [Escherichia coli O157:H7 str. TW14588]EGD63202.1 hypothetical protein ECoA_04420 [Escherichia coli O157:H7 str. 1044]EHU63188.1 hypothetical protein ECDEC3A_1476 [Escherichia coli DEC3A]EHU63490.1 hypothetical protein ECDEC3B_1564 [Escherichia coli DEC3B]EHU73918.1 hypothetical protein ECDEC3C_2012 [Escherichia